MAFLDEDEILVLELNGTARHVMKNMVQPEPLLDLNVLRIVGEGGLLGIAVSTVALGHTYVYLYYTESQQTVENPWVTGYIGTSLWITNQLTPCCFLIYLPTLALITTVGQLQYVRTITYASPIGELDNVDDKDGLQCWP
jgi:hypothetical protein